MSSNFTKTKRDSRSPSLMMEDHERADVYATRGSVEHFLLRLGYFPNNEENAEGLLLSILSDYEDLQAKVDRAKYYGMKELE